MKEMTQGSGREKERVRTASRPTPTPSKSKREEGLKGTLRETEGKPRECTWPGSKGRRWSGAGTRAPGY